MVLRNSQVVQSATVDRDAMFKRSRELKALAEQAEQDLQRLRVEVLELEKSSAIREHSQAQDALTAQLDGFLLARGLCGWSSPKQTTVYMGLAECEGSTTNSQTLELVWSRPLASHAVLPSRPESIFASGDEKIDFITAAETSICFRLTIELPFGSGTNSASGSTFPTPRLELFTSLSATAVSSPTTSTSMSTSASASWSASSFEIGTKSTTFGGHNDGVVSHGQRHTPGMGLGMGMGIGSQGLEYDSGVPNQSTLLAVIPYTPVSAAAALAGGNVLASAQALVRSRARVSSLYTPAKNRGRNGMYTPGSAVRDYRDRDRDQNSQTTGQVIHEGMEPISLSQRSRELVLGGSLKGTVGGHVALLRALFVSWGSTFEEVLNDCTHPRFLTALTSRLNIHIEHLLETARELQTVTTRSVISTITMPNTLITAHSLSLTNSLSGLDRDVYMRARAGHPLVEYCFFRPYRLGSDHNQTQTHVHSQKFEKSNESDQEGEKISRSEVKEGDLIATLVTCAFSFVLVDVVSKRRMSIELHLEESYPECSLQILDTGVQVDTNGFISAAGKTLSSDQLAVVVDYFCKSNTAIEQVVPAVVEGETGYERLDRIVDGVQEVLISANTPLDEMLVSKVQ